MSDPSLFELVMHHRYADLRPHDHSGCMNVGYGAGTLAPGRGGEMTAALFDGAHDRVFVPPSPTLSRPGGIRADMVVNVEELGQHRTLIEGYLSFALGVDANGALGASVFRYREWNSIRSLPRLVPLGDWIEASFMYTSDGVMTLWMNGELVAEQQRRLGPAPGVSWPFGLNVGAWPDADQRVLAGRVEEVRLWRAP